MAATSLNKFARNFVVLKNPSIRTEIWSYTVTARYCVEVLRHCEDNVAAATGFIGNCNEIDVRIFSTAENHLTHKKEGKFWTEFLSKGFYGYKAQSSFKWVMCVAIFITYEIQWQFEAFDRCTKATTWYSNSHTHTHWKFRCGWWLFVFCLCGARYRHLLFPHSISNLNIHLLDILNTLLWHCASVNCGMLQADPGETMTSFQYWPESNVNNRKSLRYETHTKNIKLDAWRR